jgi:pimeloyl-ACP methyl ester carboxylesterase
MRSEMLQGTVAGIIEAMSSLLPDVDREALVGSKELGQYMIDTLQEGLKINCDGWVDDDLAFTKPWGFELSEIKVPTLLYQGSEDKMVPFAHGQWLAKHLPQEGLKVNLLPGQGHISIFLGQRDSMIKELKAIATQ